MSRKGGEVGRREKSLFNRGAFQRDKVFASSSIDYVGTLKMDYTYQPIVPHPKFHPQVISGVDDLVTCNHYMFFCKCTFSMLNTGHGIIFLVAKFVSS